MITLDLTKRDIMAKITWRPKDNDDLIMSTREFYDACMSDSFIDDDGYGHFATDKSVSNLVVTPSAICDSDFIVPPWASHVCWYNK